MILLSLGICKTVPTLAASADFVLAAPEAASVLLRGSWPGGFSNTELPMVRGADGRWTLTVNDIPDGVWAYDFAVDGVPVLDPGNPRLVQDARRWRNLILGTGPLAALAMVQPVPHGGLHHLWYPSPSLGMTRRVIIYTPPGYDPAGSEQYPVLYLMHGGGGDESSWTGIGRAAEILDNLLASGAIVPMIVVMPNGNGAQQAAGSLVEGHPGYGPTGEKLDFPDSIGSDLLPFVDSQFRTIATCDSRAIAGLSMGGAQAFYTVFKHREQFCWLGAFSGGYTLLPGISVPIIAPANAAQLRGPDLTRSIDPDRLNALVGGISHPNAQPLRYVRLSIGGNDTLITTHKRVHHLLEQNGIDHCLVERPGYVHEWRFWREELAAFTTALFRPYSTPEKDCKS